MAYNNNYRIRSSARWEIPGDVPRHAAGYDAYQSKETVYNEEQLESEVGNNSQLFDNVKEYSNTLTHQLVTSLQNKKQAVVQPFRSSVCWKVPGDVPRHASGYDAYQSKETVYNEKQLESEIVNDSDNNSQLFDNVKEYSNTITHQLVASLQNNKQAVAQPLMIMMLLVAGMFLDFTKFDNQMVLTGNESFAALNAKTVVNDANDVANKVAIDLSDAEQAKAASDAKNKDNHKVVIKLTNKPSSHSKIIIHTVVKGDTLWDIAERYVKDPFRYPELAKLSNIINPDLIYPGNIVQIQS